MSTIFKCSTLKIFQHVFFLVTHVVFKVLFGTCLQVHISLDGHKFLHRCRARCSPPHDDSALRKTSGMGSGEATRRWSSRMWHRVSHLPRHRLPCSTWTRRRTQGCHSSPFPVAKSVQVRTCATAWCQWHWPLDAVAVELISALDLFPLLKKQTGVAGLIREASSIAVQRRATNGTYLLYGAPVQECKL